jgi:hypothetical protein
MLQNSVAFLNMLHMQRKILHSRYFFAPLPDILAPQFHNFDRQKKMMKTDLNTLKKLIHTIFFCNRTRGFVQVNRATLEATNSLAFYSRFVATTGYSLACWPFYNYSTPSLTVY